MCGSIKELQDGKYQVSLVVKDTAKYCGWGWLTFKARFGDELAAREWLLAKWETITTKYQIHILH